MIIDFTEEQNELREVVHRFLTDHVTETAVRETMATESGYDAELWRMMGQQLGLQGIAIPEEYGGHGFGWIELGIILEEMGRALLCAPYFSSVVLAANTLLVADEEAKRKYLPGIADGSTIATLAYPRPTGSYDVRAQAVGDTWQLSGRAPLVLDAHVANLLLVAAWTVEGLGIFAVEADAAGLATTVRPTLDQTRKLADVSLENVNAVCVVAPEHGEEVLTTVLDRAVVGLAAEQVGGANAALDMAVEYMKVRVQFGQPIGQFQALKHMAADVLVEVETARSAAYYAIGAVAADDEEVSVVAPLAAAYCTDAYVTAAHQNIQFHGGMGFTWELPAHLYFKRARSSQLLFGDAQGHRAQVAERLGV